MVDGGCYEQTPDWDVWIPRREKKCVGWVSPVYLACVCAVGDSWVGGEITQVENDNGEEGKVWGVINMSFRVGYWSWDTQSWPMRR